MIPSAFYLAFCNYKISTYSWLRPNDIIGLNDGRRYVGVDELRRVRLVRVGNLGSIYKRYRISLNLL